MDTTARFRFSGEIDVAEFCAFAAARARRLGLDGRVAADTGAVCCEVAGPTDLVDAFEMACLLGPPRSLVTAMERIDGRRLSGAAA
jgi:acylphosphatase